MNRSLRTVYPLTVVIAAFIAAPGLAEDAPGTAFTYQGVLNNAGRPAGPVADLRFRLYETLTGDGQVGPQLEQLAVALQDGRFTVALDFGVSPFVANQARFIEIDVRSPSPVGTGAFTTLAPRQALAPTPFALNTRGINVDDQGNVGIGTDTPATKLDVRDGEVRLSNTADDKKWELNYDQGGNHFYIDEFGAGRRLTIRNGGNVGIGMDNPQCSLEVNGGIRAVSGVPGPGGSPNYGYTFTDPFFSDSATGMYSLAKGSISFYAMNELLLLLEPGVVHVSSAFRVSSGDVRLQLLPSSNSAQIGVEPDGQVTIDTSTRRHKADITPLVENFGRILDAQPQTYTRPEGPDPQRREIGYIAEEFHDLGLTRLVFYDDQGLPLAINYSRIGLYLVEVAKQQRDEIAQLKADNQSLRSRLERLEGLVSQLARTERVVDPSAALAAAGP